MIPKNKTNQKEQTEYSKSYEDLNSELNAIIDSSSDGLWVCDSNAKVIRINPASERINQITAADVLDKYMEDLVGTGFFDKSVTLEVLKQRKTINLLQQRGNRKLVITGTPVFNHKKELIRVVVSEHDITEIDNLQKKLEEQESLKNQFRNQIVEMQLEQLSQQEVIAQSPAFVKVLNQALKVSTVDSTVLLLGESGVGKGMIADLIHSHSNRSKKPIIKINCGAIPETLIESELFGYEKGAFTSANSSKPGQFELADGGTLFLDEIAELPLSAQVKVLRLLEDGNVTRLGGNKAHKIDVRILAATHRNLENMLSEGTFRLDLYYRLKVIPIYIPALRERKECIPSLVRHYIDIFGEKTGTMKRLTQAVLDAFLTYEFPGNVRELINICERLVVMTDTESIGLSDLPHEMINSLNREMNSDPAWPQEITLPQIIDSVEREVILNAMKKYSSQHSIASSLGVSQATIARKLKKIGVSKI